jgi:hypothetical protein
MPQSWRAEGSKRRCSTTRFRASIGGACGRIIRWNVFCAKCDEERAVGPFPDGKSALMLAGARLRHVAGTKWGTWRYMDINGLPVHRKGSEETSSVLTPVTADT